MKRLTLLMVAAALAGGPVWAQNRDGAAPEPASADPGDQQGQEEAKETGSDSEGKKIYRVRDENGNVVFTDEPPEGSQAEEVELKKGNSMSLEPAPEVTLPEDEEDEEKAAEYKVKLVSPAHEQTFQHPTEPIPIEFNVQPALKEGFSVQVLHNGKPLEKPELDWPVRGEHKVQVRVVNADGETVASSDVHTLYVHRPSRKLP